MNMLVLHPDFQTITTLEAVKLLIHYILDYNITPDFALDAVGPSTSDTKEVTEWLSTNAHQIEEGD
jgi:hypothetical protein